MSSDLNTSMVKESGGPKNVGFTREDVSASTRRLGKYTKVKNYHNANSILQFLADKSNNEEFFYWDVQLDDDGRLMNFFFRDYRCLVDYEFFGDVLSVDSTYRIKVHSLICVLFEGINHHRQNVMFGMAFMSDETTDSFQWLLETFMTSMNKKEPHVVFSHVVFSYQCEGLMNAIDNTFKTATHRINHNALSHFGSLNGNDEFEKMWRHCMNGCETEDEFKNSWKVMIETFDLSDHTWFGKMYGLRRKWASVFTNGRFSAGLSGTLHCTSLERLCSSGNSLYNFVRKTEQLQADRRTKEVEADACGAGIPRQFVDSNEWLMHAARVYTRNMYKRFEDEVQCVLSVNVMEPLDYNMLENLTFNVTSVGSPTTWKWRVKFNRRTHCATCTCRMWETDGVLCCHILRIYYVQNVMRLPDKYVIKRWTRRAKVKDVKSYALGRKMEPDMWVKCVMREFYHMLMESKICLTSLINEHMVCLVMEFNAMSADATFAAPVQGSMDGRTELQSVGENIGLHLQLDHSFSGGQDCAFQASKKACPLPNAQCDRSLVSDLNTSMDFDDAVRYCSDKDVELDFDDHDDDGERTHRDHNHELYPQYQSYRLPLPKMPDPKTLHSYGMGVSRACRSTEKESGGSKNVGFTQEDVFVNTSQNWWYAITRVRNLNADSILEFLADKSREELFYWNLQLDINGKLMDFFFRDYRCLVDYESFGDVLSVDAAYRLETTYLICVPFVGLNHHRQKVMFGMGFVSNETIESFEWLLKTFMKSMNGKKPQVVFSDQCPSLMNAIDKTFRTASHRINHDAPSGFSSLYGNDGFKNMWRHCMNGCETEDEFENSWKVMIETFDLSDHMWFGKMYGLRRKWASVFTNDRFSAGLSGTLHCTSLKRLCSSSNSLYDFVLQTQQLQADWRTKEAEEDAMGDPGQLDENNEWLKHAAQVYTRNMYKIFESEVQCLPSVKVNEDPNYNMSVKDLVFKVSLFDSSTSREWRVNFNSRTHRATCTCHMWEIKGVLCRHILKVFSVKNVMRLPEQYIIKRWTRRAKLKDVESYAPGRNMAPEKWAKYNMRECYDMLMKSNNSSKFRTLIKEHMLCLVMEFHAMRYLNATSAKQVQALADELTEFQNDVKNMGLHLQPQLNHGFFDGQNCDFQASQKTCSFPNAQCDTSAGVKGKGKRKLQLSDEDIV